MNQVDDNDLALRWQSGEGDAYNQLVHRHLDPIRQFIRSRLGVDGDADDVCQEVFLEIYHKISTFDPRFRFRAWLYTIARRRVIDRQRRIRPTEQYQPDLHSGADARTAVQLLEERESGQRAWEFVFSLLPESQAMALWLRVQEEMPISQIADTMEKSEANVKVLLFRARQHLAREWKPSTQTV